MMISYEGTFTLRTEYTLCVFCSVLFTCGFEMLKNRMQDIAVLLSKILVRTDERTGCDLQERVMQPPSDHVSGLKSWSRFRASCH